MYFVATNHIEYFDPAITRGQRFDAVIFVTHPSFDSKTARLKSILAEAYGKTLHFAFSKSDIDNAIPKFKSAKVPDKGKTLPKKNALAKFALLRWDELPELAVYLHQEFDDGAAVSNSSFTTMLQKLSDRRLNSLREYFAYVQGPKYARRDYGKLSVWALEGLEFGEIPRGAKQLGSRMVYPTPLSTASQIKLEGYSVEALGMGQLRLKKLKI
jgi:hypothetical protein